MLENCCYPVILTHDKEDKTIYVDFVDFDTNNTFGDTIEEAINAAQEVIALCISDYEEQGIEPPKATDIANINGLEANQSVVYVNVWLPFHRADMRQSYQKKTLTIPTWLNMLATRKNINFSQVLTNALKRELGIKEQ